VLPWPTDVSLIPSRQSLALDQQKPVRPGSQPSKVSVIQAGTGEDMVGPNQPTASTLWMDLTVRQLEAVGAGYREVAPIRTN
jgi:hypothetical protein